jgi:hypothetical protein
MVKPLKPLHKTVRVDIDLEHQIAACFDARQPFAQNRLRGEIATRFDQKSTAMPSAQQGERRRRRP